MKFIATHDKAIAAIAIGIIISGFVTAIDWHTMAKAVGVL